MRDVGLHIGVLYGALAMLCCVSWLLWLLARRRMGATDCLLMELGSRVESKFGLLDSRHKEFEGVADELATAKDQQAGLLLRNVANRSIRKEILGSLRSGLSAEVVSAKFEIPRNEVRLLAKVQTILNDFAAEG